MNTAKNLQLLDAGNNNISPATNIESLYYEINLGGVIYRNAIYKHFPVYVHYNNNIDKPIYGDSPIKTNWYGDGNTQNKNITFSPYLNNARAYAPYTTITENGSDILISAIKQTRLANTKYFKLDVSTYNLTNILTSYADASFVETTFNKIDTSIHNIIYEPHLDGIVDEDDLKHIYTTNNIGGIRKGTCLEDLLPEKNGKTINHILDDIFFKNTGINVKQPNITIRVLNNTHIELPLFTNNQDTDIKDAIRRIENFLLFTGSFEINEFCGETDMFSGVNKIINIPRDIIFTPNKYSNDINYISENYITDIIDSSFIFENDTSVSSSPLYKNMRINSAFKLYAFFTYLDQNDKELTEFVNSIYRYETYKNADGYDLHKIVKYVFDKYLDTSVNGVELKGAKHIIDLVNWQILSGDGYLLTNLFKYIDSPKAISEGNIGITDLSTYCLLESKMLLDTSEKTGIWYTIKNIPLKIYYYFNGISILLLNTSDGDFQQESDIKVKNEEGNTNPNIKVEEGNANVNVKFEETTDNIPGNTLISEDIIPVEQQNYVFNKNTEYDGWYNTSLYNIGSNSVFYNWDRSKELIIRVNKYTYPNQKTSSKYTFEVNNIAYTLSIDENIYNIQFNQIITISDDNYTYFIVPGDKLSGQQEIYINMDLNIKKITE